MHCRNYVWPGDIQDLVATFEALKVALEIEITLGLQHGAHGSVSYEDTGVQQVTKFGHGGPSYLPRANQDSINWRANEMGPGRVSSSSFTALRRPFLV